MKKVKHTFLYFLFFMLSATLATSGNVLFAEYTGTPFPDGVPHQVPGTIEAEDFDEGGEGIAYHDKEGRQNGSTEYRTTDVDVQTTSTGGYNIGFTESGEWTKYTINATQAGTYQIKVYCVSGNNNGKFHLEIDDVPVSRTVKTPYAGGSWHDYSNAATIIGVQLTEGIHVLTWFTYGGMNIDKFVFERTGEWTGQGESGNFNYPITKKMSNPLFVSFDSPMHEGRGITTLYTADPSAHVWSDGRLYVYASHDMDPPQGCDRMDRYHVFSTDDMENWTDHGEILRANQVPWGRAEGGFMWAPDCVYKNGTYYFIFPHPSGTEWNKTWKLGIATSNEPAANFTVKDEYIRTKDKDGNIGELQSYIDPSIFLDEDGTPYLIHGGGNHCWMGELEDNMMFVKKETYHEVQGLVDFHEGPWLHKKDGVYYLSYPDNHGKDGNQLRYATSDNILGPWKHRGVYLYATGCDTSHGSIVEYKGQWYAFYHTSNHSGQGNLRSVCFDPLTYNADGTINVVRNFGTPYKANKVSVTNSQEDVALVVEAEDFNEGGEHYAYHSADTVNTGNNKTYRAGEKVNITQNGDVIYVSGTTKGEWMRYSLDVEKSGVYNIECITAKGSTGNDRFHISVNGNDASGTLNALGTVAAFGSVTAKNIVLRQGEQYLDVRVEDGTFNLDKLILRVAEPYQGKMYTKGNHDVPGIIEAEDYDMGGMGIAYFENDRGASPADANTGGAYRNGENEGVDLESNNGRIYVSHTSNNEWVKYTLNVTTSGLYNIKTHGGTGANSGSISLSFDNMDVYPVMTLNTGTWSNYTEVITKDVELTKGEHVMTLNFHGGVNVDKFEFELVGTSDAPSVRTDNASLVQVYPNPSNGFFKVEVSSPVTVDVVDINGKVIYRDTLQNPVSYIDISGCASGIYSAIFRTADKTEYKKLIIK